jgi:tyrosinase
MQPRKRITNLQSNNTPLNRGTAKVPPFPCHNSPPEGGGGCVTTGPFANMTVNLGPLGLSTNPNATGLEYSPRYLRRDLRLGRLVDATHNLIEDLISNYNDIASFQKRLEGQPDEPGLHNAGHGTIGRDPGDDIAVSPGDPMFFLNHGGIDQVWWRWQNIDLEKRRYAIAYTKTLLNNPPSENVMLDDVIQLGVLAPPVRIRDLMKAEDGLLCYTYG